MNRTTNFSVMLKVCIVLILVFVTACSNNSTNSDSNATKAPSNTATAPNTAAAPETKEVKTVKVAVIAPLTGAFAQNGANVVKGSEFAVEEINANGGIKALNGAKLELVVADTGTADPSQAASVTRRVLQDNPDLTAVIGLWASSYTIAGSTVTEQEKIPLLSQSFTDEITARGYKYVFQFPAKASVMGDVSVKYLTELAAKANYTLDNIAIVSDNQSSNKTVGQTTAKKFKENGVKVSIEEYYQPGITDATSISTKIVDAKPNLVFVAGAITDLSLIMKTLRGMGYTGVFLGTGAGYVVKEFKDATGDAGNGSFATAGWNWDFPYPGAAEFNKKYMAKYNEPFAPQEAGEDYAMVYALKEALEKAGSTDRDAVRDALAKVDMATIMTGGNVSFDETGMNKDVLPVLIEWIDGMPRSVYPPEVASTEPVFMIK